VLRGTESRRLINLVISGTATLCCVFVQYRMQLDVTFRSSITDVVSYFGRIRYIVRANVVDPPAARIKRPRAECLSSISSAEKRCKRVTVIR
jgi:hypothetical protein